MKVLIMTRDLSELGGTQTWVQTMAKAIMARGHEVHAWAFLTGLEMPCETFTELPQKEYDLILINHNTVMGYSHHMELKGIRVFTSHGPLHPLERTCGGAQHYVGVSEEVRMVQAEQGYMSDVIRQPIDVDLFNYDPAVPRWNKALIMCKKESAMKVAAAACKRAGIEFDIAHYRLNPIEKTWELLPNYSLVITTGRGALEAVASGCQVLSFNGPGHADGWLTPNNFKNAGQFNYSGRYRHLDLDDIDLEVMLRERPEYGPDEEIQMGTMLNDRHNSRKVVDQYLAYAEVPKMIPISEQNNGRSLQRGESVNG